VVAALQKQWDPNMDIDELQCMLANLVNSRLIKGYIAYETGTLILAPVSAFPEITN